MKTYDFGNNETKSIGISKNNDGTFTAITFSTSKTFNTYNGAAAWLAKRGYEA